MESESLRCDGCGQNASPAHIAARLARLERATRFRPLHIRVLLLGAVSPATEDEFLYSSAAETRGEAAALLRAAGILPDGKAKDAVIAELQRTGVFATHVLECPLDAKENNAAGAEILMRDRLSAVLARIRRSLKPKRVILFSAGLQTLAGELVSQALGCPLILRDGKPFDLSKGEDAIALREAMTA